MENKKYKSMKKQKEFYWYFKCDECTHPCRLFFKSDTKKFVFKPELCNVDGRKVKWKLKRVYKRG